MIWLRLASPHPFPSFFLIFSLFLQRFSIIFLCEKLNLKSIFVILSVTRLTRPSWRNKLRQVWVFGEEWSWTDDRFSVYLIFCVEAVEVAVTMPHTKQSEGSNLGHGLHKLSCMCCVYIVKDNCLGLFFEWLQEKDPWGYVCCMQNSLIKNKHKTTLECELQMLWNTICILLI